MTEPRDDYDPRRNPFYVVTVQASCPMPFQRGEAVLVELDEIHAKDAGLIGVWSGVVEQCEARSEVLTNTRRWMAQVALVDTRLAAFRGRPERELVVIDPAKAWPSFCAVLVDRASHHAEETAKKRVRNRALLEAIAAMKVAR